jgi:hypothetical protein
MSASATELKGFNYPLTQKVKSTLNPSPPWYYSADFLNIEFYSHRSTGKAGPALAPGSKFAGSITDGGQRLAEALVTLKEPVTEISLLKQRPVINLLHYPRLAADRRDKSALHKLVENVPHDPKIEQAWIGEGSLRLPVCRGQEISDLAPVRSGKGIRASMVYIVDDLKTLKDLS